MTKDIFLRKQIDEDSVEYLINPFIQNFIQGYFELDFFNKKVKAPYYMNTKRRKDLRALVGKGLPSEMILETKVWAQVKKVDLKVLSEKEIRNLMIEVGIGIDCSGLVVHTLHEFFRKVLKKRFFKQIRYKNNSIRARLARYFRPVENLGADDLTSDRNTTRIDDLNQVRPGDLIRGVGKQRNAYHVAIVTKVVSDLKKEHGVEKETVKKIFYVHSHRYYEEENGVRRGEVVITDPKRSFLEQDWKEVHSDGRNYFYEDISQYPENSGFRRLALDGIVC
jgi:hypothetical protein